MGYGDEPLVVEEGEERAFGGWVVHEVGVDRDGYPVRIGGDFEPTRMLEEESGEALVAYRSHQGLYVRML